MRSRAPGLQRRAACVFAALATLAIFLALPASALEICDGRDDDLDGTVDPGCPSSCDDPRSAGAEIPLSAAASKTTLGRDRTLAWDGAGFAAAWSERVGADTQIRFRRVDPAGVPRGPALPVGPPSPSSVDAVIDVSPSGYGIAWSEEDFGLPRILFAFVDREGQLVTPATPVGTADEAGERPSISWDGSAFVVAWAWYNSRVHVRRVAADGMLLTPDTCVTCAAASGVDEVSIALGPGQIGYAYSDGKGAVLLLRSDRAGQPLGDPLVLRTGAVASQPSLVYANGVYAAAWYDRSAGDDGIYVAQVSTDGALIGAPARANGSERYAGQPNLAWTGAEYLLAYAAGEIGELGVALRRLDAAGTPLAPPRRFPIERTTGFPNYRVGLAWSGARPAVLRDEDPTELSRPARLRLLACCADADADGIGWCDGDLDDGDPAAHPGATETCDGRDNDQDGTLDEGCDRECAGAALDPPETRGVQPGPGTALAAGGAASPAYLVRAAGSATSDPLLLERGGPPWSSDPLEGDPAESDAPAVAWTGSRAASVFRDLRDGDPALRFSARDGAGAPLEFDRPLTPPEAETDAPVLAWGGRRLALGSLRGTPVAEIAFDLLTPSGARLLDEPALGVGTAVDPPAIAVAPDRLGGSVVVFLRSDAAGQAVLFERRDEEGARRGAPLEIAPPLSGRRDPAVVATDGGYLVAWSGPEGPGGAREIVLARIDPGGAPVGPPQLATEGGGAPDEPALAFTGEEVALVFRDRRVDGTPRLYWMRLAVDGARLAPDLPLGTDAEVAAPRAAWDGRAIRLAWTRAAGDSFEIRTSRLDCGVLPPVDLVRGLRFVDRDTLAWDAVAGAVYDLVSGDLAPLAAGAGYAASIDACEASRTPATTLVLPPRALPRFYLARAVVEGSIGSYAGGGAGEAPGRDAGIGAAATTCP